MSAVRRTKLLLRQLVLLFFVIDNSKAGQYYCSKAFRAEIELNPRANKTELLIPTDLDGNPVDQCYWLLTFTQFNGSQQMVLQGVPGNSPTQTPLYFSVELQYQMYNPSIDNGQTSGHRQRVFPGLFQVLNVDHRTHLKVFLNSSAQESQSSRPISMKIELPTELNSCGRDMLSFRHNCFAVSSVPLNLRATMSSIRGDAQLASFSSMAEIEELVAANNLTRFSYPFKPSLNLSQPVRIGMFRGEADAASVLSVVRDDGDCQLLPVFFSDEIRTNGSHRICVSLQVKNSGKAELEFTDCSQPMLSLVSFREIPRGVSPWERCVTHVDELLVSGPKENRDLSFITAIVVSPFVLLAVLFAIIWVSKRCARNQRSSVKLEESAGIKLTQDANNLKELNGKDCNLLRTDDTENGSFIETEV